MGWVERRCRILAMKIIKDISRVTYRARFQLVATSTKQRLSPVKVFSVSRVPEDWSQKKSSTHAHILKRPPYKYITCQSPLLG